MPRVHSSVAGKAGGGGSDSPRSARKDDRLKRDRQRPRVLVVDDNADARLILEGALTAAGYAVTVATNGYEALALLQSLLVDLMVIDLQMPELGGKPTIRAVRALGGRLARMPIVVVSAFAPESLPGVQAVITKPASLDVLVERIAELLQPKLG
jgi:CheY-like chemotaxis protein